MCGIAGFTSLHQPCPNARDTVRAMADTLRARGPDGDGYLVTENVALGHRRLSIIDLEGGAQPMTTPDGRYSIVFNGEIYNYVELRRDLEQAGVSFRTQSDTEVLLEAFARKGPKALNRFNGMFAFALWDRDTRELFLARDRMGVKPLFYALADNEIVFGSELKALMEHPRFGRRLDKLSFSKFLTFGYIPAPHTIYQDCYKLQPGEYLTFSAHGLCRSFYWDIPLEDNPISTQNVYECGDELMALMRDAVRLRLRSDVPLGVFLSGGIDSSLITALAAETASNRISTFSIGFEEASYDESPFAREVAEQYGTDHHCEILSAKRALDLLPEVMDRLDEPFADASILPTALLCRHAAQHVKVALGGDAGDELFAGYPSFQAHKIMNKLAILPVTWRDAIIHAAKKLPVSHKYASVDFLLQQFFKGAGISSEIRFFMWMGCFGNEQKRRILSRELQDELRMHNAFEDVLNYVRQSRLIDDFQRIQYLCMKLYMQDGILTKVDRASMAHSLEVRGPFLDYRVVEFAAGIQPFYKLRGLTTKYILKKASAPLLSKRIRHRRKAGFMMPVASWMRNELRPLVEARCADDVLERDGLFDPRGVRRLLNEHFEGTHDHRKLIWPLLCFQTWRERYGFQN